MARSPFAGIENEDIGGPREPFLMPNNIRRDLSLPKEKNIVHSEPAEYYLRIDETEYKETRKSGGMFKVKFLVIGGNGPNLPGSVAAWGCMHRTEGFKRDVKTFCCTAMNYNPENFRESDSEAVIARAQPLTANKRYVKVIVENIKTKGEGKDFSKHSWFPVEATFDPATGALVGLNPPTIDQVAEFIRRKGEIK